MRRLSPDQARRIALAAQGFHRARPSGRIDVRHFRKVMATTKVTQLDSVNVAVRAHYMPYFSRLGAYDRDALDAWINGPEIFEYWAHVASVLPVEDLPMLRYRMSAQLDKPWRAIKQIQKDHPEYLDQVMREVSEHGPLTISELSDPGTRTGPWWGYGRGKNTLEWLYVTGRLVTRGRTSTFKSIYDTPARFFSREQLAAELSREDAHRLMVAKSAEALGVATIPDLADYYRIRGRDVKARLPELLADGTLIEVEVEGWGEAAYMHSAAVTPRRVAGRALLAPFDPLVWHRDRTERIFDFHYRIEIYVPEAQRVYGYYVYPFLLDGELVGRVDLKADRKSSVLLARGSYVEPGQDASRVARELASELHLMGGWLGLEEVHVQTKGNLATALRKAL